MKTRTWLQPAILSVALVTACSERAQNHASTPASGIPAHTASATTASAPPAPSSSSPPPAPTNSAPPENESVVSVSVAELVQHSGVPMGISFPHPPGWVGGKLDLGLIAWSSSPPGGPGTVNVWTYKQPTHDFATLTKLVRAKHDQATLGTEEKLTLAGAERIALASTEGASLSSSARCSVLLPGPPGTPSGLVVELLTGWRQTQKATCAEIVANPSLAQVVQHLSVDISGSD